MRVHEELSLREHISFRVVRERLDERDRRDARQQAVEVGVLDVMEAVLDDLTEQT